MILRILNSMKRVIYTIKNNQSEIKKAISGINNTLEGINSRLDEAEYQISDLKDKAVENIQCEQQKKKYFKMKRV